MSNDNLKRDAEQSEADAITQSLHALRDQIISAWGERAVVLTYDEQVRLRDEIHETCEMLTTITRLV